MNRLVFYFALAAAGFCMSVANAQTNDSIISLNKNYIKSYEAIRIENKLSELKGEKEIILATEKYELQKEVDRIDALLASQSITKEEAIAQKEKAAKKAALNIDNKNTIVDNQIALLERGSEYNFEYGGGSTVELGLGNAYDENGSALFGVNYKNGRKEKKYDKRTYTDMVLGVGMNNTVRDGQSFGKSPYRFSGSGTIEAGFAFRTRMFKNSNAVRLVYGLSLQFNTLRIRDNKYFTDEGNTTVLAEYPAHLKVSQIRFDNLLIPFHFEFGPSTKTQYKDYFRYSTNNHFRVGIGGYAGLNLGVVQKLKYEIDGEKIKEKMNRDYNVNKFLYGVSTYVGYGPISVFLKYDLNPLFESPNNKEHSISTGLRFDF